MFNFFPILNCFLFQTIGEWLGKMEQTFDGKDAEAAGRWGGGAAAWDSSHRACHSLTWALNLPAHFLGRGALCCPTWLDNFSLTLSRTKSHLSYCIIKTQVQISACAHHSDPSLHHTINWLSVAKIHGAGKLFNNAIYRGFCDDFFVIQFWSDTYTILHHQRSPQNLLE